MNYLILSILCSSFIFVIFKLFDQYGVNTTYAIIINYLVACTTGILLYSGPVTWEELPNKPYFLGCAFLGVLFIAVFNLMGKTSQKLGVSVASVATKMSLVIPVLFGVILFKEELSNGKILGIVLALFALYFSTFKEDKGKVDAKDWLLPIGLFLGSGLIDAAINYMRTLQVPEEEFPVFSSLVFFFAATTGILFMLFQSKKQRPKLRWNDILGGIVLGIPNYFSIYFLLKSLEVAKLNSATIFTTNNVAIVLFSTLLGIVLFHEKLTLKNWLGLGIAVLSIILVVLT